MILLKSALNISVLVVLGLQKDDLSFIWTVLILHLKQHEKTMSAVRRSIIILHELHFHY